MRLNELLPHNIVTRTIDGMLEMIGRFASYIWIVLLAVIVINVVLRYLFEEGHIELEELQWHLYSAGFLLGLSYAYKADTHIRVDVLHERLPPKTQAWIELYGIFLFLLPFIALVLIYAWPFVATAWRIEEKSQSASGLSMRWIIKAALPFGFTLLFLAVISRLIRVWCFLFFNHTSENRSAEKIRTQNQALKNTTREAHDGR